MPGAPEPLYVLARRTLLDALEALGGQRRAIVLVGAQAIYMHAGEADFAVAPYTTDADLAIEPSALLDEPKLKAALEAAGLVRGSDPGEWVKKVKIAPEEGPIDVHVDVLVPEALAGRGRRGANLGVHGREVARRVKGLEAALVDFSTMSISALEDADKRRSEISVAGGAALLVAKLHKINDRAGSERSVDKDALDTIAASCAALAKELLGLLRK